jgi:hypothetical protein
VAYIDSGMKFPVTPFLAALLVWPFACAHGRQPEASGAAAADAGSGSDAGSAALPPGCEQSLAGEWQHQDDPSYRYTASDDGGMVTLLPRRVTDQGAVAGGIPEGTNIVLRRSPAGFSGKFNMIETLDSGKKCPASFGAQIVTCEPEKVTLRIEQSYAVDEACNRVPTGGPDVASHVLVRWHATPPKDAGPR